MSLPLTGAGSTSPLTSFTPASLSPALWLKADAITGLSDGAAVNTWTDSSGNGHDAAKGTYPAPIYKANGLNGLPTVVFGSPVNQGLLVHELATLLSGDNDYTMFVLCHPTDMHDYPTIFVHGIWDWLLELDPTGTMYWGWNFGEYRLYATALTAEDWSLFTLARTGTTSQTLYKNGAAQTPFGNPAVTETAALSGDMTLGYYRNGENGFVGDVPEILHFPTALSTADRQKIEGYLAWKWGRQTDLPSDHPYKASAP